MDPFAFVMNVVQCPCQLVSRANDILHAFEFILGWVLDEIFVERNRRPVSSRRGWTDVIDMPLCDAQNGCDVRVIWDKQISHLVQGQVITRLCANGLHCVENRSRDENILIGRRGT